MSFINYFIKRSFVFFFLIILIFQIFILTFFIPPFQKADEYGHYWRAISVAEGNFFCKKDQGRIDKKYLKFKNFMQVESHVFKSKTLFPVSLIKNYNQLFKLDKEDSSKFEVGLCQNSPFGYLFNIIGFYLGQIFNLNLLYQFYLMRLIPALFYLFFVFILEKNIINPPSKIFFLVFSSLPMILHQISAISLDSSIFIFFTLFLFSFLNYLQLKIPFYLYLMVFSLGIISIIKPIYLPLICIPIILRRKILILFVIIFFLSVSTYQSKIYEEFPLNKTFFSLKAQKKIIFQDPQFFVESLINFFRDNNLLFSRFNELFGVFGWTDSSISFFYSIILFYFLILISFRIKLRLNQLQKILIFVFTVISVIFAFYGTYLGATTVGSRVILGLQGRYFLIFLPIFLLISKEFTLKLIRLNILLLVIFIFITFNIFSTIKNRYFNYFSNLKLGKKCIDSSKISGVIVVNQEFKKKLFNRTYDRESIESLVIGFCIKIINEKDSPSYTYRIELIDDNNKLIDRHYLRLIGRENRFFTFFNKNKSSSAYYTLKIKKFYSANFEIPIKVLSDQIDLIYAF